MFKKKTSLLVKILTSIVAHPWIKAIALVLAIMIWFYARSEISRFNY